MAIYMLHDPVIKILILHARLPQVKKLAKNQRSSLATRGARKSSWCNPESSWRVLESHGKSFLTSFKHLVLSVGWVGSGLY